MKIVIIVPNFNGHFSNYIDIIKSEVGEDKIEVFKSFDLIKIFKFCLINKSICEQVIFLHGDRDFLISFFLRIFFIRFRISLIIYYSFEDITRSLKSKIKSIVLKLLSHFRIRLLLLEGNIENKQFVNIKIIYDPILLNFQRTSINVDNDTTKYYLVAGYLDDRKLIPKLIELLESISLNDSKKRVLTLLGVQSNSVKEYLSTLETNNIKVISKNYRYKDAELQLELFKADVVWALYRNHYGSSGMVINAIQFNKSVIFRPIGVLGNFAKELKLNVFLRDVDKGDSEMKDCLLNLEDNLNYTEENRIQFLKKRTQKQFVKTLIND